MSCAGGRKGVREGSGRWLAAVGSDWIKQITVVDDIALHIYSSYVVHAKQSNAGSVPWRECRIFQGGLSFGRHGGGEWSGLV